MSKPLVSCCRLRGVLLLTVFVVSCTAPPVRVTSQSLRDAYAREVHDYSVNQAFHRETRDTVLKWGWDLEAGVAGALDRVDWAGEKVGWRDWLARAELSYALALDDEAGPDRWPQLTECLVSAYRVLADPEIQSWSVAATRALRLYRAALSALLDPLLINPQPQIGEFSIRVSDEFRDSRCRLDRFDRYELSEEFHVDGIRSRHIREGVGLPLVAVRTSAQELWRYETPEGVFRPATLFVRPGESGELSLSLLNPILTDSVRIGANRWSLAADFTAPYALLLSEAKLHSLQDRGFFKSDVDGHEGLFLLEDYNPQQIPVVMIHGLWSSPATWRELTNEILGDPVVRKHYQVWHYLYATGAPLLENARQFRSALLGLHSELLDRGGVSDMVLVGHSMGGVLSRIMLLESGDQLWSTVFEVDIDRVELDPELKRLARELFFFEPLAFVKRAVFVAAPHRGSPEADSFFGRLGSSLISTPKHVRALTERVRRQFPRAVRVEVPTSVDKLSSSHEVLRSLQRLRVSSTPFHTILGEVGDGSDGVVPHSSSRLANAVSEVTVAAAHAVVQSHPDALREFRRILCQHYRWIKNSSAAP